MTDYNKQAVSFWFDTLAEKIQPRPILSEDIQVDVAIIGAGFTGLWTAYYLNKQQPDLRIAIIESETAGFGASGRNGGWLMGALAGETKYLAGLPEPERQAAYQLIFSIIDEVKQVLAAENIDCDLHHGGSVYAAARYPEQLAFQQSELKHLYQAGLSEDDYRWLNKAELDATVRMRNGMGAIYTPHCAAINPAKLVRGLAECLERKGVSIYEQSAVTHVGHKQLQTAQGSVRADVIVPATEGFADELMGLKRYVLPIQSLIVATEPLTESKWDEIGLADRPTFSDAGRMATYGQRSADGRIIFGARGGYIFGGKVRHQFALSDPAFREREQILRDLFPSLASVNVTHGWGGTLGMARNFTPFAVFDANTGIASAGGYGGEGVGAANLFGRTLADMILQKETQLTAMPWAFTQATHKSALKRWEPEPCRWLTYQTLLNIFSWEEELYNKGKAPAWLRKSTGAVCDKLALLMA
ncbi:NAD(P)/FAD-dependent oxidoreductase [Dasania marina]|uniref:NAD(P)/FAD-dependent oxidoreductase n=1 Tax=Dasania marina TaxID=471499 RepID=UPI00036D28A6|nr:FAD-dependent oxidoreductase [Dasania marina]